MTPVAEGESDRGRELREDVLQRVEGLRAQETVTGAEIAALAEAIGLEYQHYARRNWRRVLRLAASLHRYSVLIGIIFGVFIALQAFLGVETLNQSSRATQTQRDIQRDEKKLAAAEAGLARFGRTAVQQNVNARYDDCTQFNGIRAGLRESVQQSKVTAPLFFRLIPSLNTAEVRSLVRADDRRELQEYAAVDCTSYALRAVPAGDRHHYRVP